MDLLASARNRLAEAQSRMRSDATGAFAEGSYNADAAQEAIDAAQASVNDADNIGREVQRGLEGGT